MGRHVRFRLPELVIEYADGLGVSVPKLSKARDKSQRRRLHLKRDPARNRCMPLLVKHERPNL